MNSEASVAAATGSASDPAQQGTGPALGDAAAVLVLKQGVLLYCKVPHGPARTGDTDGAGNTSDPKRDTDAAAGDVRRVTSPEAADVRPLPASSRVGLGPVTAVAPDCADLLPSSAAVPSPVPGNEGTTIEVSASL